VRLRRGIKAWGNCLAGHHEVGGQAARGGRSGQRKATGVDRRGGEDTSDKQARLSERRGRGDRLGRARTERENVFSVKTRLTRGLDGPAGMISAQGDCAAGGLAGPESKRVARLAWPKARKMISELKIGFLNLPRLWKFVEGDLGGILTRGFSLNSSRLLKDFRKI
jgi:hypothetical protein